MTATPIVLNNLFAEIRIQFSGLYVKFVLLLLSLHNFNPLNLSIYHVLDFFKLSGRYSIPTGRSDYFPL